MGGRRWDIPLYAVSPLVLAAGGVWGLLGGIGDVNQADLLADRGVRTTATVTSERTSCGMGCAAAFTYTFTTPDGLRHTGSDTNHDRIGATVDVWYDPQRPDDLSTIHAPDHGKAVAMVVLGSVLVLVGIGLSVWLIRNALS